MNCLCKSESESHRRSWIQRGLVGAGEVARNEIVRSVKSAVDRFRLARSCRACDWREEPRAIHRHPDPCRTLLLPSLGRSSGQTSRRNRWRVFVASAPAKNRSHGDITCFARAWIVPPECGDQSRSVRLVTGGHGVYSLYNVKENWPRAKHTIRRPDGNVLFRGGHILRRDWLRATGSSRCMH